MMLAPWWVRCRSDREQDLGGTALVHGPVAVGGLLERKDQVEDLAGVDRAVPDELDELRQEATPRGRPAVQVHARVEQLPAGQRDLVGDTDVPDVPAGARGAD